MRPEELIRAIRQYAYDHKGAGYVQNQAFTLAMALADTMEEIEATKGLITKSHELKALNICVTLEEMPQAKIVTPDDANQTIISPPNTNNDQQSPEQKKAAFDALWNALVKEVDSLVEKQRKE